VKLDKQITAKKIIKLTLKYMILITGIFF